MKCKEAIFVIVAMGQFNPCKLLYLARGRQTMDKSAVALFARGRQIMAQVALCDFLSYFFSG